jgi:hypothetical protein
MKKIIKIINMWFLSPLFIFTIIILFLFMIIDHFSISMIDMFTHITIFFICISFYIFQVASKEYILDLLILNSKNDLKINSIIEKYFEFKRENDRHLSFQADSILIWVIILFYNVFFMPNYDGLLFFCMPISFTILISIYIDNLYEFIELNNIHNTLKFMKSREGTYRSENDFKNWLIENGIASDSNYFKYQNRNEHNYSWNILKFYLAIIIFLPLLFL